MIHIPKSAASSPHDSQSFDKLLKDDEVEAILGVADGFLAKDRCMTARLPYVKIGRCVRYRASDVQAFITANVRTSTSDEWSVQ